MSALNFSNTNSLWASILVETLFRLGLSQAIICPGSRSAPLAVAFASHPQIEAIPILDERSAAFFALGLARRTGRAVALVCTSGTAGANFYPAVIEARESRVPLLVLTADRPPELRDCNAGQAIDQHKLFGGFANWYSELALPATEPSLLAYLRQTVLHGWRSTLYPVPGPVQLNLPFREPLPPIPQPAVQALAAEFDQAGFFRGLEAASNELLWAVGREGKEPDSLALLLESRLPLAEWLACDRGIIIAGPAQPPNPRLYCEAIAHLSRCLGWPVLAEALSPVRNYASLNPALISTYDLILRNRALGKQLAPSQVIRIGEMPTSKELRLWLEANQPRQWVIDPGDRNLDPLHGLTTPLPLTVEAIAPRLPRVERPAHPYRQSWEQAEAKVRFGVDQALTHLDQCFEGKVVWLLSQCLPEETPLFIASSMPVRDAEFFWQPGDRRLYPYFNRGANGIDGTLSTAMGVLHGQQPGVLLTGDLALLHDTNGFLNVPRFRGHLTIILINNQGGGIFEMLPISRFQPPFEEFFATPQTVDFARLCAAYNVAYERIQDWDRLQQRLTVLPDRGVRLLEIPTDRKADAQWRQNNLGLFAATLT